ncbi:aminoglycoside phosphotransferase family protein [Escherichia coli]
MFYDPADRDDLCLDPRRIAQMADAFSRALDVDPRRLLDQAYAYGCLSAAWNADGEEEQRDLAIAAAISRCDRRHTRYQATSPIPWNTSISPENIAGQSLSVGFRPFPQTTPNRKRS